MRRWGLVSTLVLAALAQLACAGSGSTSQGSGNAGGTLRGLSSATTGTRGGASAITKTDSVGTGSSGPNVAVSLGCPSTCEKLSANCGTVTDTQCGGVVWCGSCANDEVCGAAGPNRCGKSTAICVPRTCEQLNANCGAVGDGCGGLVDCGDCPAGQVCGTSTANHCDAGERCVPKSCRELNHRCGLQGDTCGNQLDCGACPGEQVCIGSEGSSRCVSRACERKSCMELGYECGVVTDGCSGTQNCGNGCALPRVCGGSDQPGKCGCKGLCSQVPVCPAGRTTSVRGKVYDPVGVSPLPHALVYIPNNPADPDLLPFSARAAVCDICGASAAGDPLVSTQTATDGSFVLDGVPVGNGIKLVVQLGRWRRLFDVDIATPCAMNSLPSDGKLTLPKTQQEGDIPRFAVVSGRADAMECVLWKMGIDAAEFTNPTGAGRVHMYRGSGVVPDGKAGKGAVLDGNTPSELDLFTKNVQGSLPLSNYDVLVLSCQASNFEEHVTGTSDEAYLPSLAYFGELVDFANQGGRIFASHLSYTYLRAGGAANPFRGTVNWATDSGFATKSAIEASIIVDPQRNARGQEFADWLNLPEVVGLSSVNPPTVTISESAGNVASVVAPSQALLEYDWDKNASTRAFPLQFAFNTPVDSEVSCGRVVFSDFHVSISSNEPNPRFPAHCADRNEFSKQEKILEYLLFDLSACVTPYKPLCTPRTCAEIGISCGMAGDGCGTAINCGACSGGSICGLMAPGQCNSFVCTPRSCSSQNVTCGVVGDGCGAALDCGTCPSGQQCGAGSPGKCGTMSCIPQSCLDQGIECGPAGDGCGAKLECGSCVAPAVCGYGGPGRCGTPGCTARSCREQGVECGAAGDGCGAELYCGNCPTGLVCGLSGPGKCGKPSTLI